MVNSVFSLDNPFYEKTAAPPLLQISDKVILEVILKVIKKASNIALENPEDTKIKLINRCMKELQKNEDILLTIELRQRIERYIQDLSFLQKTQPDLALDYDWREKIEELAIFQHESSFVKYVGLLLKDEVENIRDELALLRKEEIEFAIESTLKEKKHAEYLKTLKNREEKINYLVEMTCLSILKPHKEALRKPLNSLVNKAFTKEELKERGLPGSQNRLKELLEEEGGLKKEMYKNMHAEIVNFFLRAEIEQLKQDIKNFIETNRLLAKSDCSIL
jgi:hypothetical protein